MIDDDVITRLVELHDHIKVPDTPPGADVLRGERMLRRRRAVVVGAAAAAVVAVLGIAAVTTGGLQAGDRIEPIQPGPTQGPTPPRPMRRTPSGRLSGSAPRASWRRRT
jgi:hypothetical protein